MNSDAPTDRNALTEDVIARTSSWVSIGPEGHPELAGRLLVPLTWMRLDLWDTMPGPARELRAIASFVLSSEVNVTLLAEEVPFEVDLRDWMVWQCRREGSAITKLSTKQSPTGSSLDAIAVTASGDWLGLRALTNGKWVLLIAASAPKGVEQSVWEALGVVLASFEFQHSVSGTAREKWKHYTDPDCLFACDYPASWRLAPVHRFRPAKAGIDLRLLNRYCTLAYLRVEGEPVRPGSTFERAFATARRELSEAGILTGDWSRETVPENSAHVWASSCALPGGPGWAVVWAARTAALWRTVVMLSPSMERDPEIWMRARRALQIVTESIQRY